MPFGEYVPLENWLRGLIQFFDLPMSGFSPAPEAQRPMVFDKYEVLPAICYEITYPAIVRGLAIVNRGQDAKPQVIATVSNDAWFGDSFGLYQHMQMARMRALELGLPLVRATNDGITAAVDGRGKVIRQLARYERATLSLDLPLTNYATLYRQYGWLGLGLIVALSLLLYWLDWWRHRVAKL